MSESLPMRASFRLLPPEYRRARNSEMRRCAWAQGVLLWDGTDILRARARAYDAVGDLEVRLRSGALITLALSRGDFAFSMDGQFAVVFPVAP